MTDIVPTRRRFLTRTSGLATAGLICRLWPAESAEPAAPVTRELLEGYSAWLHYERRLLSMEMYPELGADAEVFVPRPGGKIGSWHFRSPGWNKLPQPSTRAVTILSAAGVPLTSGEI